ncbi:MAG: diacylglycerol kinase family lipid kinase [Candidatus Krumholzibacteria bacterium]|nr:diacylglycerol kinase family lipid kinase [Candidatus Krumholzibacteria bacterium]
MKVAIIANPRAGRGRAQSLINALHEDSSSLHCDISIEPTRGPGDGSRLARELSKSADVIGIVGGDGTVHEVVNGLMPNPIPIVIFPAGTGNDYASLFRCPKNIKELAAILKNGQGARVDVLDLGDQFCVNCVGMGFEGLVNRRSREIKRIRGSLLYLVAVFKTLSSLACPRFKISTPDGVRIEGEKLLVSIGNGNRTGGAFYLTPNAVPDDGLVDVCLVDAMNWLRVLRLLPLSLRGSHVKRPEVRIVRAASLEIETDPEFPMHVDGETVDCSPERLTITVRPRVLPVLCDAPAANRLSRPREKLI